MDLFQEHFQICIHIQNLSAMLGRGGVQFTDVR